jgi:hypothetical protein
MTSKKYGGYQWTKFLEHWWMLLFALIAWISSEALIFFMNLSGRQWIYLFVAGFLLLFSGAALIVYAKLPAYRSGQFFTFGTKSIPKHLHGYYHWGWRVFLFGVTLSLCLLLSKF